MRDFLGEPPSFELAAIARHERAAVAVNNCQRTKSVVLQLERPIRDD
jgi:hypothetical protein